MIIDTSRLSCILAAFQRCRPTWCWSGMGQRFVWLFVAPAMRFPTNQPVALRRKPVGRIYSRLLNDAIPGATAGEPSCTQSRCGRLTLSTLAVRLCDR